MTFVLSVAELETAMKVLTELELRVTALEELSSVGVSELPSDGVSELPYLNNDERVKNWFDWIGWREGA